MNSNAISGAIIGTAVGDALGLAYEGLSPARARKLLGTPDRYRFVCSRGMVSDDTEHTCLVALALCASAGDPEPFGRRLAWGIRWWLVGMPAGVGWATLRAGVRLWFGYSHQRSGVFSAGNGPAMRSAVIGAAVSDREQLVELVKRATRITHTDQRAYIGALAVALAARQSAEETCDGKRLLLDLRELANAEGGTQMLLRLQDAVDSYDRQEPLAQFLRRNGHTNGASGYVVDTVGVAIRIWLNHPESFENALIEAVSCGGDADTLAAIVGGIVGARCGDTGIPTRWREGLCEWPRSVAWMGALSRELAAVMHSGQPSTRLRYGHLASVPRNFAFLLVVIAHIFRRLLPPY